MIGAGQRRDWLLLALTPLLPLLAAIPSCSRWALPLLAPLSVYAAFAARVRRGDYEAAWQVAMVWTALLSLGVILLVELWPAAAAAGILNGEPYRKEMFGWIATGAAPENDWRLFLPVHLEHLGLFLLLTWVSGGYLGLVLGAALVDWMSYFVGSFAVAGGHPVLGAAAAWVPWSVLRVFAFVLLGAVFARPLLVRRPWPFGRKEVRLMALAAAGLVADVVVKMALAPTYGLWLREMARHAAGTLYSGAFRILG
ncbi:MAG: hypothetical protein JOZ15_19685 [Acidobacteria bacterium]|nr:hypothetical protein [Acidobacteriota bacterium]